MLAGRQPSESCYCNHTCPPCFFYIIQLHFRVQNILQLESCADGVSKCIHLQWLFVSNQHHVTVSCNHACLPCFFILHNCISLYKICYGWKRWPHSFIVHFVTYFVDYEIGPQKIPFRILLLCTRGDPSVTDSTYMADTCQVTKLVYWEVIVGVKDAQWHRFGSTIRAVEFSIPVN